MRVHVLASGSTGNAALFQFGNTCILVDAGISARRIEIALARLGVQAGQLDAILITHEHSDHIKGLDVLVRRHAIPVYTRPQTWECLTCRDRFPSRCCIDIDHFFSINQVDIEAVDISHDAVSPVGFCFHYQGKKAVLLTDLGIASSLHERALSGAHLVVLEANHDPEMLARGPYPAYLKKRILGARGHLANIDTARLLTRISIRSGMKVLLAHISQHNNRPELARHTVSEALRDKGYDPQGDILLQCTHPDSTVGAQA